MPNHVHALVWIVKRTPLIANKPGPHVRSIGAVVGGFKASATRRIRDTGDEALFVWQRNYYEHIVRDEPELNRIREYIIANPAKWTDDRENPAALQRIHLS